MQTLTGLVFALLEAPRPLYVQGKDVREVYEEKLPGVGL